MSNESDEFSQKRPYLAQSFRQMIKSSSHDQHFNTEGQAEPWSELHRPYLPEFQDMPSRGWEDWAPPSYTIPGWTEWEFPGLDLGDWDIGDGQLGSGLGGGAGGPTMPKIPEEEPDPSLCPSVNVQGKASVFCGQVWVGEVTPSTKCVNWCKVIGIDASCFVVPGAVVVVVPNDVVGNFHVCVNSGYTEDTRRTRIYCSNEVEVQCCCEEFELTGNNTAGQNDTWTGTITPACPGATCDVTAGGGGDDEDYSCEVSEDGSEVYVTTSSDACAYFTVTVTAPSRGGNCTQYTASKGVRISAGSQWCSLCGVGPDCGTVWCTDTGVFIICGEGDEGPIAVGGNVACSSTTTKLCADSAACDYGECCTGASCSCPGYPQADKPCWSLYVIYEWQCSPC